MKPSFPIYLRRSLVSIVLTGVCWLGAESLNAYVAMDAQAHAAKATSTKKNVKRAKTTKSKKNAQRVRNTGRQQKALYQGWLRRGGGNTPVEMASFSSSGNLNGEQQGVENTLAPVFTPDTFPQTLVIPKAVAVQSNIALVQDQTTGEVIYAKNTHTVAPIASITKLMTVMTVLDAQQALDETLAITAADVSHFRGKSRLTAGGKLSRGEMMLLALMSSENRAAHALLRNYPGGLQAGVMAMNRKAASLGMTQTHFVDPTGLSSENRSTPNDLAKMLNTAYRDYPKIREFSTTPAAEVYVSGKRRLAYRNSNALTANPEWQIGVSKTGYINEAGKCLVMQARVHNRNLLIVLLDSGTRYSRITDAQRIRNWLEEQASVQAVQANYVGAANSGSAPATPIGNITQQQSTANDDEAALRVHEPRPLPLQDMVENPRKNARAM